MRRGDSKDKDVDIISPITSPLLGGGRRKNREGGALANSGSSSSALSSTPTGQKTIKEVSNVELVALLEQEWADEKKLLCRDLAPSRKPVWVEKVTKQEPTLENCDLRGTYEQFEGRYVHEFSVLGFAVWKRNDALCLWLLEKGKDATRLCGKTFHNESNFLGELVTVKSFWTPLGLAIEANANSPLVAHFASLRSRDERVFRCFAVSGVEMTAHEFAKRKGASKETIVLLRGPEDGDDDEDSVVFTGPGDSRNVVSPRQLQTQNALSAAVDAAFSKSPPAALKNRPSASAVERDNSKPPPLPPLPPKPSSIEVDVAMSRSPPKSRAIDFAKSPPRIKKKLPETPPSEILSESLTASDDKADLAAINDAARRIEAAIQTSGDRPSPPGFSPVSTAPLKTEPVAVPSRSKEVMHESGKISFDSSAHNESPKQVKLLIGRPALDGEGDSSSSSSPIAATSLRSLPASGAAVPTAEVAAVRQLITGEKTTVQMGSRSHGAAVTSVQKLSGNSAASPPPSPGDTTPPKSTATPLLIWLSENDMSELAEPLGKRQFLFFEDFRAYDSLEELQDDLKDVIRIPQQRLLWKAIVKSKNK